MYVRVIPFKKTFDNKGLVYFIPEHLLSDISLYQIVTIPIKDAIEIAVVVEKIEKPQDIDISKIKSLIDIHNSDLFLFSYQAQLIDFVSERYITPIHNALGVFFPRNLREKIQKGTLSKVEPQTYNYNEKSDIVLTPSQQKSYQDIQNSQNNQILFYGVTGSGKTEIYRKIISENLKKGKQSLLLIPEIILGNQIGERVREMFGPDTLIITSQVSEAKKTQYWKDIYSGNAKIIVGTRSALFYPYQNLGAVIVDEEHDSSYVSDSAPRYSSIDIVSRISQILDIPVIFASGTPSVKNMHKAMSGEYQLVTLLEKYS